MGGNGWAGHRAESDCHGRPKGHRFKELQLLQLP
jgi:hypothetical protein